MDVKEIVGQLKGIRCHSTIRQKERDKNIKVLSCPDAIAKVIEKVMMLRDHKPLEEADLADEIALDVEVRDDNRDDIMRCPECGAAIEHEEGCVICRNCGFSKCH